MLEDEFINYLLETYEKLNETRPQIITYVQTFKKNSILYPNQINFKEKLVKINDYTKK